MRYRICESVSCVMMEWWWQIASLCGADYTCECDSSSKPRFVSHCCVCHKKIKWQHKKGQAFMFKTLLSIFLMLTALWASCDVLWSEIFAQWATRVNSPLAALLMNFSYHKRLFVCALCVHWVRKLFLCSFNILIFNFFAVWAIFLLIFLKILLLRKICNVKANLITFQRIYNISRDLFCTRGSKSFQTSKVILRNFLKSFTEELYYSSHFKEGI